MPSHQAEAARVLAATASETNDSLPIDSARPRGQVVRQAALWILLAATYVLAGKLGLALAFINPSTTAVWPPTGIALAAVLIFGPRVWPGIFLGAFLTNEATAGTLATSLLIAAGNTLEALLGGHLVNRFAGGRAAFDNGRNIVLYVLLAGLVATSVSATVGVTSLSLYGFAEWSKYWPTWLTWWLGDAAGAVVVAPVILLWTANPRLDWSRSERIQLLLLLSMVLVVGWLVFVVGKYPLTFLCIPVCVWAGFRFGQREAATATCVLSMVAVWGSTLGLGAFAGTSPNDALLLVEGFMAVATVVGLTVGAAASGRRLAEEKLRRANSELELAISSRTGELRASEARLVEAQHVAHVGSWEWRIAENHLWWSDELYRMFGLHPSFTPTFDSFLDLVHPDDRQALQRLIEQSAKDSQPFESEQRVIRPDGEVLIVRSNAHAIQDDRGQVTRMLGTAQDITDRKRLEEHLQQAQKMEAIGRLAGGIAHDFNNLLTVIMGYSEQILAQIGDNKPISADLHEIRKAGESAAALTRQMLTFSRREATRLVAIDLNAVIANVERLLRRTLGEGIRITTNLSPDLHTIQADATQLQQVIMNLAVNARDAMPRGGTLTITTTNVDRPDAYVSSHPGVIPSPYVQLTVSDTGHGMDDATKARIFEPFFTTKERNRGTGLGLATVYGIVQLLGGTIRVDSQVGRGTTFKLYFPETLATVPAEPEALQAGQSHLVGKEAVLVVEDDQGVREFAACVLRRYGYRVHEAGSGAQALSLLERLDAPIDLLITDVIMPQMTGCELVDRFHPAQPGARLLYMSGYTDEMLVQHGLSVPTTAQFLPKPFTSTELLQKVRDVLDADPNRDRTEESQGGTRVSDQ